VPSLRATKPSRNQIQLFKVLGGALTLKDFQRTEKNNPGQSIKMAVGGGPQGNAGGALSIRQELLVLSAAAVSKQGLAMKPRLALKPSSSCLSRSAGITGMNHHTWLF
jgi:hypothetical protein